jgi:hypothetical protein
VLNDADLALTLANSWMHTMLERGIDVRMPHQTVGRLAEFYEGNLNRVPQFVCDSAEQMMKAAQPKTAKILKHCWGQVKKVAEWLLKHNEIVNNKLVALATASVGATESSVPRARRNKKAQPERELADLAEMVPKQVVGN